MVHRHCPLCDDPPPLLAGSRTIQRSGTCSQNVAVHVLPAADLVCHHYHHQLQSPPLDPVLPLALLPPLMLASTSAVQEPRTAKLLTETLANFRHLVVRDSSASSASPRIWEPGVRCQTVSTGTATLGLLQITRLAPAILKVLTTEGNAPSLQSVPILVRTHVMQHTRAATLTSASTIRATLHAMPTLLRLPHRELPTTGDTNQQPRRLVTLSPCHVDLTATALDPRLARLRMLLAKHFHLHKYHHRRTLTHVALHMLRTCDVHNRHPPLFRMHAQCCHRCRLVPRRPPRATLRRHHRAALVDTRHHWKLLTRNV